MSEEFSMSNISAVGLTAFYAFYITEKYEFIIKFFHSFIPDISIEPLQVH